MADTIKTNLGPVTAYADAKAHGYTGTREEFGQLLAGAAGNLQDAVAAKEGAEAAKQAAETAQQAAAENQKNAETQAANAKASADSAAEQANFAKESAAGAANSATAAQESEINAGLSATAAANAEAAAKQAQNSAETAKTDAEAAQTAAGNSADAAANSAADAKKTLESIPDDYSTLSGKVDENASGIRELKEEKLNKPALPVVGELLRVKSVSDAGEVEVETEDISELKKRQNVLVGSESGNPVSCDDAFEAPLCGLHIYGKSTQDVTPTPDAPVPIVSAGDGGNVLVTLSDGNSNEQTLTLQTPTGLPGIPATSGDNYTDPQGKQWVCDEVNLERGIYIKRVSTTVLTVDMVQSLMRNVNDYCIMINPPIDYKHTNGIRNVLMSNRFIYDKKDKKNGVIFGYGFQIRLYVDPNEIETLAAAKEFIEKNQTEIMYEVNKPTETPLTPAELAAYKALTTYAPTTIVQASAGAGIRLGYQRDVNLVVKNLEDAIASMTTT